MDFLDLTLPTPAENLALDEALLEEAEYRNDGREVLRLWESTDPFVVVGRSSRVDEEVNRTACSEMKIPVLRRSSGGASIVTGPGCLMYAVVLSYEKRAHLRMIASAHRFVLNVLGEALGRLVPSVEMRGTSDLTRHGHKFSGNSLRCKRQYLLYHGTVLYDFPLDLISRCLNTPPRQPEYRNQRDHSLFVSNLPAMGRPLRQAIRSQWSVAATLVDWPRERTQRLVADRYSQDSWNFRL